MSKEGADPGVSGKMIEELQAELARLREPAGKYGLPIELYHMIRRLGEQLKRAYVGILVAPPKEA